MATRPRQALLGEAQISPLRKFGAISRIISEYLKVVVACILLVARGQGK
jgi:hypothetical protein